MQRVNNIDFSGVHMLENVVDYYRERGGDVFMVGVNYRVRQRMVHTEFDGYLGQDHFLDEDNAISQLFYHVLNPAVCIYECPYRVFQECQNLPKRLDLIEVDVDRGLAETDVQWIDAHTLWQELHTLPAEQRPVVVDVREPREFRQGHIVEARSLPLAGIGESDPGLPPGRDIVIVCRTSRRSRLAAGALRKLGYDRLKILEGGMVAWDAAGLLEAVDAFPEYEGVQ
jgi:SulP family sulfate permease